MLRPPEHQPEARRAEGALVPAVQGHRRVISNLVSTGGGRPSLAGQPAGGPDFRNGHATGVGQLLGREAPGNLGPAMIEGRPPAPGHRAPREPRAPGRLAVSGRARAGLTKEERGGTGKGPEVGVPH